ncbi:hypothetical protein [Streptomyces sp. NPDC021096]|uniref:hypothetical protein n=1 Tax=Streptomyces sp. NPDC021096 TaxID=3154792 RepID=UPI0033D5DBD1
MNPELRTFITGYLDLEQGYYVTGSLRRTLHGFNATFTEAVRSGLAEVMVSRELSVEDYDGLTGIEFESEAALYDYLGTMHDLAFYLHWSNRSSNLITHGDKCWTAERPSPGTCAPSQRYRSSRRP